MLRCTLQDGVGRYLVIENHGAPTGRFPLRADNGAQVNLASFLQDFKQDLHLTLVCNGVQQEIVQNEQSSTADLFQSFLVWCATKIDTHDETLEPQRF